MGEFDRGVNYATAALSGLAAADAEEWARNQRYRLSLSLGGDFNRGIECVLAERGLTADR
ncbi:hypothetical protein [Mycobacterium sp. MUNTM1]